MQTRKTVLQLLILNINLVKPANTTLKILLIPYSGQLIAVILSFARSKRLLYNLILLLVFL